MSAVCPKCGANLSCSCKLRTGSNGEKGCTRCIAPPPVSSEKPKYLKIRRPHS